MALNFNDMMDSVVDAEATLRLTDKIVDRTSRFLISRLRFVDPHRLKALKRQLRNFNASTLTWNDE